MKTANNNLVGTSLSRNKSKIQTTKIYSARFLS